MSPAARLYELADLRDELVNARTEYELCSYIDHYPDVVRCRDRWQKQIDLLQARIGYLEGEKP